MQLVFDFPINTKCDFSNFVICSGNRTAFQFARLLADDPLHNLLYIYGPAGSGKTHLLRALAGHFCSVQGQTTLPYISFREIDDIYGGNYPGEAVSKLAERFHNEPALLMDDIHLLPDNAYVRTELWQLFNDFYGSGRKIAITGLYPPRELPHLDGHLISRLLWGLVARIEIPDDDSLRIILKKLAADRNIHLPAEVIDHLIVHTRRELPALIDSLELIRGYSLTTKRRMTLRLAREALQASAAAASDEHR